MRQLKTALLSSVDSTILGHIIEHLLNHQIMVDSVLMDSKTLSDKDKLIWEERTAGQLQLIPVSRFESYHIPYYYFSDHSSNAAAQFISNSNIDLLVNAGTPRILTPNILSAPNIGVLNCHPGLLPDYRGCTCVEWAIYFNERIGNTIHLMTCEIDEGPVILQESLYFNKSDKYHDVRVKVYKHGFELTALGILKIMENPLFDFRNMQYAKNGRYFDVIDSNKMRKVMHSINSGEYRFQF